MTKEAKVAKGAKAWRQEESEPMPKIGELTLSAFESRRLLAICVELIDLCSKVSGKIDPAVGHLVAHARDEVLIEVFDVRL